MSTIKNFEEMEIWQLARELVCHIYDDFRNCKDFVFKNQVCAAGLSLMNNIAEGFSRDTDREFRQFLNISKGSDGEAKSMYYVAEYQSYVSAAIAKKRRHQTDIIRTKTTNFMFYLKSGA
jgi:four helix bundle protein